MRYFAAGCIQDAYDIVFHPLRSRHVQQLLILRRRASAEREREQCSSHVQPGLRMLEGIDVSHRAWFMYCNIT